MVAGTILVFNIYAYALFDPGATHSFISTVFVAKHDLLFEPLETVVYIEILMGDVLVTSHVCKSCVIKIGRS